MCLADETVHTELDSRRDLYSCSEDSLTESLALRSLTSACHRSRCIRKRAISSPFSSTLNAKSLIVCSKSAYKENMMTFWYGKAEKPYFVSFPYFSLGS